MTNAGGALFANRVIDGVSEAGWAINVAEAPNEVDVNLDGGNGEREGIIHGNIAIAAEDTITVDNGKTIFDGQITPEDVTVVKGHALSLPSNLTVEEAGIGTLDIAEDGIFEMVDADDNNSFYPNFSHWGGNAEAHVGTFKQEGTLEIDVGPVAADTPTIAANAVTLGGTVSVLPGVGLYPIGTDTIVYRVVFGPRDGSTWSTVQSASLSPLFKFDAEYPNSAEADIGMSVAPFDQPFGIGLTPNEEETGDGLTNGYNTSLGGNACSSLPALFQVPAADYPGVLDELYDAQAGELVLTNANSARATSSTRSSSIVSVVCHQAGGMSLGSLMVNPVESGTGLMANAVPGSIERGCAYA